MLYAIKVKTKNTLELNKILSNYKISTRVGFNRSHRVIILEMNKNKNFEKKIKALGNEIKEVF